MEAVRLAENPVASVRQSTRTQTLVHVDEKVSKFTKIELGFIKNYTFNLATRDNWTIEDFGIEKNELRSRYSVMRNKLHFTSKWNDEKLLRYLRKNAYRYYNSVHT